MYYIDIGDDPLTDQHHPTDDHLYLFYNVAGYFVVH